MLNKLRVSFRVKRNGYYQSMEGYSVKQTRHFATIDGDDGEVYKVHLRNVYFITDVEVTSIINAQKVENYTAPLKGIGGYYHKGF